MLVDQGSQNGTVINGNRILQVNIFFLVSFFCFRIISFTHHPISKTSTSSMHTCFIFCSPKLSVIRMHWCTVMKWRWERLCYPSTSTQGLIPVMAVSPVRWWLTSASTGERRLQVSHPPKKAWSNPFLKQRLCVRLHSLVIIAYLYYVIHHHVRFTFYSHCIFPKCLLSPKRIKKH